MSDPDPQTLSSYFLTLFSWGGGVSKQLTEFLAAHQSELWRWSTKSLDETENNQQSQQGTKWAVDKETGRTEKYLYFLWWEILGRWGLTGQQLPLTPSSVRGSLSCYSSDFVFNSYKIVTLSSSVSEDLNLREACLVRREVAEEWSSAEGRLAGQSKFRCFMDCWNCPTSHALKKDY